MSAQTDVAIRGTRSAGGPGFRQRAGGLARSAALWVIAAILLLLAGIVTVLVRGGENTATLHYESTGEDGGHAFVEVLRDHGRDVTTTERYLDAAGAVDAGGTVLIYADGYALTEEAMTDLSDRARESGAHLVLIDPQYSVETWTDALLFDMLSSGDQQASTLAPGCSATVPSTAGTVTNPGIGEEYFATVSEPQDSVFCYSADPDDPAPHGMFASVPHGEGTLTVLSQEWLMNSTIHLEGHMSLTAGVLTPADPITYYYPVERDQPRADDDTSPGGNAVWLFPQWAVALLLWSVPVVVVALLVYGRRMGPLAIEPLPVVVPAAETVRGRSALLQRAGGRAEALRDLRAAALVRLGRRLALPPDTPAAEVSARAAAAAGLDPAWTEEVLLTEVPHDDPSLIRIAIDITTIESEVHPL